MGAAIEAEEVAFGRFHDPDADAERLRAGGAEEDRSRRSLVRDPSIGKKNGSLRPSACSGKIVDHREHGDPAIPRFVEEAEELESVSGIEMGGGLVQKQHAWLLCERAREARELSFASGERLEPPLRETRDPGSRQRPIHLRLVLVGPWLERSAMRISPETDSIANRQGTEALLVGSHEGKLTSERVPRPGSELPTPHSNLAPRSGKDAGQDAEQRRLSRGIRTYERHGLARTKRQRDSIQHRDVPAMERDAVGLEERARHRPSWPLRANRR